MNSTKEDKKDLNSIQSEEVHVHGPNCNHHHHELLRPIVRETPKVGRNEPCPCGSGLKYKKCHGNV